MVTRRDRPGLKLSPSEYYSLRAMLNEPVRAPNEKMVAAVRRHATQGDAENLRRDAVVAGIDWSEVG